MHTYDQALSAFCKMQLWGCGFNRKGYRVMVSGPSSVKPIAQEIADEYRGCFLLIVANGIKPDARWRQRIMLS